MTRTVALSAIVALALAGCGSVATTATSTPTDTLTPSASAPPKTPAPDTVGMTLDEARAALEEAGYAVDLVDAGGDRSVWEPKNWTVISQEISGTQSTLTIDKTDEMSRDVQGIDADETASAEAITSHLLAIFGVQAFSDYLAKDPASWVGVIESITTEPGLIRVTVADATIGDRAAKSLSTLLPEELVRGVRWIVVQDSSGVVISQEQPRPAS